MSKFSEKAKAKHKAMSGHLRTLRKDKGLTMRVLAQSIGTPHSFIGKIEKQDRRLDIAEFLYYCEGLGKDPVEVFTELVNL